MKVQYLITVKVPRGTGAQLFRMVESAFVAFIGQEEWDESSLIRVESPEHLLVVKTPVIEEAVNVLKVLIAIAGKAEVSMVTFDQGE